MNGLYHISNENDVQVLSIRTLVNEIANREIMEAVESRMDRGFLDFVVDLSNIHYMNSVGINFLILIRRRLRENGGRLAVVHASDKVKQLLDITKLRQMFFLSDSLEDAMTFVSET